MKVHFWWNRSKPISSIKDALEGTAVCVFSFLLDYVLSHIFRTSFFLSDKANTLPLLRRWAGVVQQRCTHYHTHCGPAPDCDHCCCRHKVRFISTDTLFYYNTPIKHRCFTDLFICFRLKKTRPRVQEISCKEDREVTPSLCCFFFFLLFWCVSGFVRKLKLCNIITLCNRSWGRCYQKWI